MALRSRLARRSAQRATTVSIAAAVLLFALVAQPALAPHATVSQPLVGIDDEIERLTHQADLIRRLAHATLAERERDRLRTRAEASIALADSLGSAAAAENAAFLLYCQADRLAQNEGTSGAARQQFLVVTERFPGTIWARMAGEWITATAPGAKG